MIEKMKKGLYLALITSNCGAQIQSIFNPTLVDSMGDATKIIDVIYFSMIVKIRKAIELL